MNHIIHLCIALLIFSHLFGATAISFGLQLQTVPKASKCCDKLVRTCGSAFISIRGGRQKSQNKVQKIREKMANMLTKVQPVSKGYLFISLFCTLVHIAGFPAPALFSLSINRWFEVWRPLTSISYLGPPSMSMANNLYFLIRFGQSLEVEYGSANYAWFMVLQMIWLSMLGFIFNFPYLSQAILSAIIYVNSRLEPMQKIPFQFGMTITSWQLPFCMMIIDCLSQQSVAPAWMHLTGIFTGHLYYFLTKVLPLLGGANLISTPQWVIHLFSSKQPRVKKTQGTSKRTASKI